MPSAAQAGTPGLASADAAETVFVAGLTAATTADVGPANPWREGTGPGDARPRWMGTPSGSVAEKGAAWRRHAGGVAAASRPRDPTLRRTEVGTRLR